MGPSDARQFVSWCHLPRFVEKQEFRRARWSAGPASYSASPSGATLDRARRPFSMLAPSAGRRLLPSASRRRRGGLQVEDLLAFVVGAAVDLAGALLTTGSRARRAVGVVVALSGLAAPWLVPAPHSLVRALLALSTGVGAMRTSDLVSGTWAVAARVVHVLSPVDTRKLLRARPSLDLPSVVKAVLWGGLSYVFLWFTVSTGLHTAGFLHWATRWGGGLAFVYAVIESAYCMLFAIYRAVGFATPPLHCSPALSRSVQELWGQRWAKLVSTWLRETIFRPMARRRRAALGVFLAFLLSALFHAYAALVALGWGMALLVLAYFLVQGAVVLLETWVNVTRWRAPAAHGWTVAWMVATSPLFVEPALRAMGR
jgi:hypothetical protein